MTTITFSVPGLPAPQGSKSYMGLRNGKPVLVESSKALAPWRQAVTLVAHNAMTRARLTPSRGAVAVHCHFVMPRPKRCPLPTPPAIKRPDGDKLARACLDSLTNVVFGDDSQVVELIATKRIAEPGEPTGVTITVEELS